MNRTPLLFSLGCILYELVTRKLAFPGNDLMAIFTSITAGSYVRPIGVPPRIASAIAGCLETAPARRIQTCEALIRTLDGAPRGGGSVPMGSGIPYGRVR